MPYPNSRAMQHYGQNNAEVETASASPHRLIQMLLEGALGKIAVAKGAIGRGNIAEKGTHIGWASSIINGLRMSLDAEAGGQIATNLDALYEYMCRRLTDANKNNDIAALDEVSGLLREIKSAWDMIPDELRSSGEPVNSGSPTSHFSVGV
jgi:flagellar protein FliS